MGVFTTKVQQPNSAPAIAVLSLLVLLAGIFIGFKLAQRDPVVSRPIARQPAQTTETPPAKPLILQPLVTTQPSIPFPPPPQNPVAAESPIEVDKEAPKIEAVIEDFLSSGVFSRASFDGGIARVKIPAEFKTLDDITQRACLDALWDYYYEDENEKSKLVIQDAKTYMGLGFYSREDGLAWTPEKQPKPKPARKTPAAKTDEREDSYVSYGSGSFRQIDTSSFGSRSKYLPSFSGAKTQRVSGYFTKKGKYVASYMRRPARR